MILRAAVKTNIPHDANGELAVIYARYSSHRQGEQSIEGQIAEAHKYAAAKGYTVIEEYIDRAKSGRTDSREDFQRMLRDTAKKQFNVIITWKTDRFGRNREELTLNKMKCHKNGVRIEYVAETIPDTPEGIILSGLLESMAEYYSHQLSQNVHRGMSEAASKGLTIGGRMPLGYKAGPDRRYAINEDTAPIVRQIYRWYADGVRISEIVQRLNDAGYRTSLGRPFTSNSLHRMLKNEKYRGVFNEMGHRIEGGVPRIVDDQTWYQVQKMLQQNKRAPVSTWHNTEYLLSDKIFCGKCGAPMFGDTGTGRHGGKYNYYVCSNKKRFHTCDKKAVRQADIEALVLRTAFGILEDTELLTRIIDRTWAYYEAQDHTKEEQQILRRQLDQTNTAIQNLLRAIEAGILNSETKARMDALTEQKAQIRAAIAELELSRGFHITRDHIAAYLYELRSANQDDPAVQKHIIRVFVNSVFVYDDHVDVTFNYSGDRRTVTLELLQSASGSSEGFGCCAQGSTKAHTVELWHVRNVIVVRIEIPWR